MRARLLTRLAQGALAVGLTLTAPGFAYADPPFDRDHDGRDRDDHDRGRHEGERKQEARWHRGDRLPRDFHDRRYIVEDWRGAHLREPPRGYFWLRLDDGFVLADRNYVVLDVSPFGYDAPPPPDDRDIAWRNRYSRTYSADDDSTYAECKDKVDPAGIAIGAVIGGLLGNAAGGRHDGGGATVAGVIAGGAVGAALTHKLDCNDRSYVYRTEMQGFNAGRVNASYEWRNPQNDHHGRFQVIDYYHDEDGFRCSVYSHTVWIGNHPEEARGRACQQPNGTWAIID